MSQCGQTGGNGRVRVPVEKDFEGGDVLRWEGIAVFPNASKLAKLLSGLPWVAAANHKGEMGWGMKESWDGMMTGCTFFCWFVLFTWLAWKMCKVGKVGGGGRLGRRGSKDVTTQVWQQVKLFLLGCDVSLGAPQPRGLGTRYKRSKVHFPLSKIIFRKRLKCGFQCAFAYLTKGGLVEL